MQDEYTFVTIDNNLITMGDAIFVDIDDSVGSEMDFVWIDDAYIQPEGTMDDYSDFITLDDMVNDLDIDSYISDISEADVSIFL